MARKACHLLFYEHAIDKSHAIPYRHAPMTLQAIQPLQDWLLTEYYTYHINCTHYQNLVHGHLNRQIPLKKLLNPLDFVQFQHIADFHRLNDQPEIYGRINY